MQNLVKRYRMLVRGCGLYDLVVTFPFALPGLATAQLELLGKVQGWLGLAGQFPAFGPTHLFFVNLFGIIAVMWAVLRIARPDPLFGLVDGLGRMAVSSLMLYYLVAWGIPQIVLLFLVPEFLLGIAQLGMYRLVRQSQR